MFVIGISNKAPRTVAYWARSFETEGLAEFADTDRPGRSRRLDQHRLCQIELALHKPPLEVGPSVNLWDDKVLSAYIKQ